MFVDTSVWSLALRRDGVTGSAEVETLKNAIESNDLIVTTGLVLQELLQGFHGPKAAQDLIERFANIPMISPTRQTHIEAARLRNHCRRNWVQAGTVDALIAQICIENDLELLTADQDFSDIARCSKLKVKVLKPQA